MSPHSAVGRVMAVTLTLLVVALGLSLTPPSAFGVQTTALKLSVAPAGAAAPATYTMSGFRARSETVTSYAVTFPAGTDVSGAQGPNPGDTVTVVGTRVTVNLATPIVGGGGSGTTFSAVFVNIRNPVTPGDYTIPSITFTLANGTSQTINPARAGDYTILASPYLTLTVTTPDAPQAIDLGNLDPGQAVTAEVLIEIDSSNTWTMTRATTGDVAELPVTFTSPAPIGIATPPGYYAYTEIYTVSPAWTAAPGIPYSVGVIYTVTQQ